MSDIDPSPFRKSLPIDRTIITHHAQLRGWPIMVRTGNYKDGTVGELFVETGGSKDNVAYFLMRYIAEAVTIGLQYRVPLKEYAKDFIGIRFDPSGEVTGDPDIRDTKSIPDYVFRRLAIDYLHYDPAYAIHMNEPIHSQSLEWLSYRHKSYIQKARIGAHEVCLCAVEDKKGKVGEIFIDVPLSNGVAYRSLLNGFATAVSRGLQHGVPLLVFVNAFAFIHFFPAGPVLYDDKITSATSIIDYVMQRLALDYLPAYERPVTPLPQLTADRPRLLRPERPTYDNVIHFPGPTRRTPS